MGKTDTIIFSKGAPYVIIKRKIKQNFTPHKPIASGCLKAREHVAALIRNFKVTFITTGARHFLQKKS